MERTPRQARRGTTRRRASGRRIFRALLVLLASVALCTFLDRKDVTGFGFGYFERYQRQVQLGESQRRHPDLVEWARNQIVLVPISETTFDPSTGIVGPPVPRDLHARVIRDLVAEGARVVAFDLVFDQPGADPASDAALAAAARRSGRVIWASLVSDGIERQSVLPLPQFLQSSPYHGHILVPQKTERPEVDSIETVVPYSEGEQVASFGVVAALARLGMSDASVKREPGGVRIGDLLLPVDDQGYTAVSYMGHASDENREDYFPRMPYENLIAGGARSEFSRDNKFFKDKIVIIGDSTAVGNDFRHTPVGYMWGPEIHAHMAASVLLAARKDYGLVREAGPLLNFGVMLTLSSLVCLLAAIWRLQWAAAAALLLLAGYYALNLTLFSEARLSLHMVAPTAAVILVMIGMLTERGLGEETEKRRMRQLLQRYISEQLAEYVTANHEKSFLGGERVTATVLFSDIRGFTSLAERLPPEEVLELLNEYMEAMTEVIHRHDGYVDKFIGDGIMAVFGVPFPSPTHAEQAVATAIEMQTELRAFQQQWQERGVPAFDIGIGINTGEMVFGNYGSKRRSDFSVIGSAVNLASRVEVQNKEWGTRILITEETFEAVRDRVQARGPRPANIRGKEEMVNLYEVLDWSE